MSDSKSEGVFAALFGRRALVTGASSGIGRAIAHTLAQAGADVLVHCGRHREAADETAEACRQSGRRAHVLCVDLEADEGPAQLAETAWNTWGGLEIVVNNAGVDLLTGPSSRLSYAEKLKKLWAIDVRGTLLISRELGRRLRGARGGVIINVGWDQADRGMEGESGELFATAKNAIMGATRSLAVSLAPEVRVNCVAPGWIKTAWGEAAGEAWQARVLRETPLARWGTPQDVAHVVRFLASDEAAYLTGQVINVNGGAVR